jgi:hypothetical protein
MKNLLRRCTGLIACAFLGAAGPAAADPILDWNGIAAQALTTAVAAGRPGGGASTLDFAMVHVAMFDAAESIRGRFEPYYMSVPGASGSPEVAVAKAAHDALVNLFPTQLAFLDKYQRVSAGDPEDPHVSPVLRRGAGCGGRPHLSGDPLPLRRYGSTRTGQSRSRVGV